ncbi:unnamed protein product [Polarella glacialis]|uniref:Uncharacterized protein n=1 Tax=Polarella glacialis TaxID=89957 RepID=A0A813HML8_POLGL|nr:unnamed protein product [Polarella glacialis]
MNGPSSKGAPENSFGQALADAEKLSDLSEVASEISWCGAVTQADEQTQQLAQVQEVLKSIFEYYACQGTVALKEPRLTSAKFQRMAMDAVLVDEKLTTAKVDVAFHRVCGSSPHMLLPQFRDAMVRLAVQKFSDIPRTQAMLETYNVHLANFQGRLVSSAFSSLDAGTMAVLAAARPPLLTLYEGYFGGAEYRRAACQRASVSFATSRSSVSVPKAQCKASARPADAAAELRRSAAAQGESQAALIQVFTDFEVLPELSPKSTAFAVFREVARTPEVPLEVRQQVGCTEGGATTRCFTYCHFVVAVAVMAHRCFSDQGPAALIRLLEWMDASKGRVIFTAAFPGHAPPGSSVSLKLLVPERLPEDLSGLLPPELRRRGAAAGAGSSGRRGSERRASSASASKASDPGGVTVSVSVSSPAVSAHRRGSSASSFGISAALASAEAAAALPDSARRQLLQTFGHYAALGDPLNRTTLTSMKFNRFLRDSGLLSSEAQGPVSFGFAPDGRRRSLASTPSASLTQRRRSGSTGNLANLSVPNLGSSTSSRQGLNRSETVGAVRKSVAGPRGSISGLDTAPQKRQSLSFTVSGARAICSPGVSRTGLPRQVFADPPLTQVEGDLVFIQAVRAAEAVSSTGDQRRGSTASSGSRARSHMSVEAFVRAIADVARRVMPPECVSGTQAVEDFCQRVIVPLNQLLMSSRSEVISQALELIADPNMSRLLSACKVGLEKIFQVYTADVQLRRPHWNSDSMSRFAADFDLLSEVSHLPLQRIFQDCSHHESCTNAGAVDGEMSLDGLQLAILMIAQKTHTSQATSAPDERVAILFQRLNTMASAGSAVFGPRFGLQSEPLLPLPKESLDCTRKSLRGSVLGASRGSLAAKERESEAGLSWEALTAAS